MKSLASFRLLAATLIISSLFTIIACKKDKSDKKNKVSDPEGVTYSLASLSIESGFDDVDQISQIASEEDDLAAVDGENKTYAPRYSHLRGIIGDSVKITYSDSAYPKTLTIDFGDSTRGNDGRVRTGKIIMQLNAPLRQIGSVGTLTLENFSVEHVKVEGTKTVTNISSGDAFKFTVKITNGKVTLPGGESYTFTTDKIREQTGGKATHALQDNVWTITGDGHVLFNNGTKVDFLITTPIIKPYNCYFRTSGVITMTINNSWEAQLDYAQPTNGNCDYAAMLIFAKGTDSKYVQLY